MPFPLAAVLTAAPSVISAAADIIRVIREKKFNEPVAQPDSQKFDEIADLIERQAQVIEELALNNSNLALAVRNNRILSAISMVVGASALILSIAL
ncbi:MAG: hypothetical protein PVJ72_10655 [Gammaproteobacteria bacterium]|jgi:hypothetical protein